jgi:hypothetical protein
MKYKKLFALVFAVALGLLMRGGGQVSAATKTWVGTACTASADCDWSTTTNWQGGVAPVSGDDIVINGNISVASATRNDISGLSVASITTSGYNPNTTGNGEVSITTTAALTVTGNITHAAPAVAAPSGYTNQRDLSIRGNIVLGGNVIATNVYFDASGSTPDTLTLGGNTFTLVVNLLYTDGNSNNTFGMKHKITGNGTFNINLPTDLTLFLINDNDYTGTTNINSVDYVTVSGGLQTAFGTSTINIGPSARVIFDGSGAVTISNVINVSPPSVTGTFLDNQLEFWADGAAVTFTVPNIVLNGNARFGVNDLGGTVQVNLAGITTNGYCVQYGTDNSDAGNFINGPSACVVNVNGQAKGGGVPKTPNTGFGLLMNNPVAVLGLTTLASLGLLFIARRHKLATKRSRR